MTLPTQQEIASGFESKNPDPIQSQKITDILGVLTSAANHIAANCNDNRHAKAAIRSIQIAFSQARTSILTPADVP